MGAELIIPLITQVGLPLATELIKLWESKTAITSADILALHAKYGTMTAADYLAQAQAATTKA